VFEAFFKYPTSLFGAGSLGFAPAWPFLLAGFVVLAGAIPVLWIYLRGTRTARERVLVALRLLSLCLLLFLLLRPTLTVSTLVPMESFVAVLVDDSASMAVRSSSGVARGQEVRALLGTAEAPGLLASLASRFNVRLFSFSDELERIESLAELSFSGEHSHLGSALQRGVDEMANLPLAGLVVLTDGADNSSFSIEDAVLDLQSRAVPVFTVGFGEERFERDIQVSRVEAPRKVLKGSSLVVEVTVEQTGFDGESVTLEVEDDGRIISTTEVEFSDVGEATVVSVNFEATDEGQREFNFRIAPQNGESHVRNNRRAVSIQVENRTEKILYFEGEPRYELKFLRRAVHGDKNLQLVTLQRTAENRFSRFELDDDDELEGGFPTTREELFRYRGLILGSIEASYFTYDQLRMIADFVSIRGGGFLMIGGRNAFSEGGWAGTPVADVLPVVLGPAAGEGEAFFAEIEVELTAYGRSHPATRLAASEEGSEEIWRQLPTVSIFNPVNELKPGATALVVGSSLAISGEQIVLAFQRYGRGRGLAWTVHDSWKWQMHADVPLEDMSHERLWRQIMRWLVSYVPDSVDLASTQERVGVGERVELRAEVMDDRFLAVNNAQMFAEVTAPSGAVVDVPMSWTVEADGVYSGSFAAEEEGTYEVAFSADRGEGSLGMGTTFVTAGPLDDEYFDSELRRALLEHVAEETGGLFYLPSEAGSLAQDLSVSGSGSTVVEHFDLWDMPILFLLIVILIGSEWTLRKRAGFA